MRPDPAPEISLDSPEIFVNRELSWLAFARRVLALAEDPELPLLERLNFAGIVGMLHDEFFMKRMGGLKRQIVRAPERRSLDGRRPAEELEACREEILAQTRALAHAVEEEIRPALRREGIPILDHADVDEPGRQHLREYFRTAVLPILTPLAVDAEHPFPFISNQGLNLAIQTLGRGKRPFRFVRLKVPTNRPRWVPLPGGGFVPLEQVIAANLDELFPGTERFRTYLFRATRGAEGDRPEEDDYQDNNPLLAPGRLVHQVTSELKARKFAGVVRLKVSQDMPEQLRNWLTQQLRVEEPDVYPTATFLGVSDLLSFDVPGRDELRYPRHAPAVHPRLRELDGDGGDGIFEEVRRGDVLLHHPYHDFDTSVLRFIRSAALDPAVLAIKLTIYRTSSDSPIVQALAEASRRGKQVAVVVEITARFDEAPNIAWGRFLENEGVHVAYGVEQLKTHVKLALVVREEADGIRYYAHVGTGNYHSRTARLYEDVGVLTCDPDTCADVAAVFHHLTGATRSVAARKLLLAPRDMRRRFVQLIRREADHAAQGRPCGIRAKMNQLQDAELVRELYKAGRAGVPISLFVRGLCCLRPGVAGLSENIRVSSVVGRFLEHSRIYAFENGGSPEYFLGSADWMKRNLDRRVETILPVTSPALRREIEAILTVYAYDNCSAWDGQPDGSYTRRRPGPSEEPLAVQDVLTRSAAIDGGSGLATESLAGRRAPS